MFKAFLFFIYTYLLETKIEQNSFFDSQRLEFERCELGIGNGGGEWGFIINKSKKLVGFDLLEVYGFDFLDLLGLIYWMFVGLIS